MAPCYKNKVRRQSGLIVLKISWIRCLGTMQAWLDLHGSTGVVWDVIGISARVFL